MDTNEYADKIVTLFFEAGAKVSKFDFDKVEEILTQARQEERERDVKWFKKGIELCNAMYGRGGCGAIYDTLNEYIEKLATLPTEGEKPKSL